MQTSSQPSFLWESAVELKGWTCRWIVRVFGEAIILHWQAQILNCEGWNYGTIPTMFLAVPHHLIEKFKNKRWQRLHISPQNINYSVIVKTHEQQSGFPQFCDILVFGNFYWIQQETQKSSHLSAFFLVIGGYSCNKKYNKTVKQIWKTNSKNNRPQQRMY